MLSLYNTLTKTKEEFKPIHKGKVGIYTCGPTVYDYIHIGNLRSYLTADTLRRYLEYLGYEVRHIKNITDVGHLTEDDLAQGDSGEDKMIKKAQETKKTPDEIAAFYEKYFHKTEKEMNILSAHFFPKATLHIDQMIKLIKMLLKKGYAYEVKGNVFYDVTKFKNYGQLSGNTLTKLKVGARLEEHPDKKNSWDFALWLKAPKEHLMKWNSPWGKGYPGWHIECSAMSTEYLGDTFDIHTGGEDNIFPHHEAEIAQAEGATGKKFVNYWLHTRHLLVDGEKMSKSKGNFYRLEDIKKKGFTAMDLRLLLLSSHYRSPLNFTWKGMKQARKNRQKIEEFLRRLEKIARVNNKNKSVLSNKNKDEKIKKINDNFQQKFEQALNDDLNTPLALSTLYEWINEINKLINQNKIKAETAQTILSLWKKINHILGLKISLTKEKKIPSKVLNLAQEREEARRKKNFVQADELRNKINQAGYSIEDTAQGFQLKKK